VEVTRPAEDGADCSLTVAIIMIALGVWNRLNRYGYLVAGAGVAVLDAESLAGDRSDAAVIMRRRRVTVGPAVTAARRLCGEGVLLEVTNGPPKRCIGGER
jgi:hypothetical protein